MHSCIKQTLPQLNRMLLAPKLVNRMYPTWKKKGVPREEGCTIASFYLAPGTSE